MQQAKNPPQYKLFEQQWQINPAHWYYQKKIMKTAHSLSFVLSRWEIIHKLGQMVEGAGQWMRQHLTVYQNTVHKVGNVSGTHVWCTKHDCFTQ